MSDTFQQTSRLDLPPPPLPHTSLDSSLLASAVLQALGDAVVVYDAHGGVVDSNPAAVALFGLTQPGRRAALAVPLVAHEAGATFFTLVGRSLPREEWPAVRVLRGELLSGADTVDVVLRTTDGQMRILNISGAPLLDANKKVVGAVCVYRDITQRKQLERELAERAAELETIFATQVEGVILVDANGRIIRMNEAQRQLLISRGIDPAVPHIGTWADTSPSTDAAGKLVPRDRLPYYRALRGETVTGERAVELHQRTENGQELVLLISGAPVHDAEGKILGAVLTTHDVTQQRRLEQQRLAIMRMVVHDLNNPVTAVRLYLQTQQRRLSLGQPPFVPDDELLGQLDYGLTRMQRLIDDLRVATQMETGTLHLQRARHDVVALCHEEVAVQRTVTGRVVQIDAPAEPVWAEVDGERIGQVIANLLSNALKYSPPDRPVGVTVRLAEGREGRVIVSVRDAGPGIPAHEQQHLFEQFHRVHGIKAQNGSGGLGLGLYISKAIVEQHGGDMGVESVPGEGSTFWFSLPLAPAQAHP